MKRSTVKLLSIEMTLILLFLLNIFLIHINNVYYLSIFFAISSGIIVALVGYEQNRRRFKKDNMMNIIIYVCLFQIFLYLFGLAVGFLKNGYKLDLANILRNIAPVILLIVTSEFMRYCINAKSQNSKPMLALSVFLFVLIDISLQLYQFDFNMKSSFIEMISTVILPSVSKNILLTYLSVKFGYEGNIVYLLLMRIPEYLIPIIPNLNIYLSSILQLLFPLLMLNVMTKIYHKKTENVETLKQKGILRLSSSILLFVCFCVVSLTSGVFPLFALSIGSESMLPNISKGDVVIVKKIEENQIKNIQKDQILIYKQNNKVIVHRVVDKIKEENHYVFKTKGDNNSNVDDWLIEEQNIIGIAMFKIKYIGYPTVWLNEVVS